MLLFREHPCFYVLAIYFFKNSLIILWEWLGCFVSFSDKKAQRISRKAESSEIARNIFSFYMDASFCREHPCFYILAIYYLTNLIYRPNWVFFKNSLIILWEWLGCSVSFSNKKAQRISRVGRVFCEWINLIPYR